MNMTTPVVPTLLSYYAELGRKISIGNTPLVSLPTPGEGNQIFAKCEYSNPGGSHYDRVYLALLSELERTGKIRPGITTLVEVTSGSAGISCSMLAEKLGYGCLIFAPEIIPEARLKLIRANGAEVRLTTNEQYVGSAAMEMGTFVKEHVREKENGTRRFFPPDHSRSEISILALESLLTEAVAQAGTTFTSFIGASGNGTTMNGIGRPLKRINPRAKVLAFDPIEAPAARWLKYGKAAGDEPKAHTLFGAGGYGIEFPGLRMAIEEGIIDDALTVESGEYEQTAVELKKLGYAVGRSSAAAYHLAKQYCEGRSGEDVLIVFYDRADRY